MELMYSIFTHSNVFTWKQFLKKNFEVQSRGTRFLGILCDSRNFPKKSQKFTNRPLGVGHVAESTQTNFFWLQEVPAAKMSHIPASYDHFWWFYIFGKFHYFRQISRKPHFRWYTRMWLRGEKNKKIKEIIFRMNFISRLVHLVP